MHASVFCQEAKHCWKFCIECIDKTCEHLLTPSLIFRPCLWFCCNILGRGMPVLWPRNSYKLWLLFQLHDFWWREEVYQRLAMEFSLPFFKFLSACFEDLIFLKKWILLRCLSFKSQLQHLNIRFAKLSPTLITLEADHHLPFWEKFNDVLRIIIEIFLSWANFCQDQFQ